MITTSTPTIYFNELLNSLLFNKHYVPEEFSTLNERYDIMADISPDALSRYDTPCFAIGNGGHKSDIVDGPSVRNAVTHSPRDVSLYSPIPFILRRIDDDLDSTERAKYRMRKILTKDSVEYIAYYLKVFGVDDPSTMVTTYDDDMTATSLPFTTSQDNLQPVPMFSEDDTTKSDYNNNIIITTSEANTELSEDELSEIKNACSILFGSPNYAIISEVCIYNGIDTLTSGSYKDSYGDDVPITYNEAIKTIPLAFLNTFYNTVISTGPMPLTLGIGFGSTEKV